MVSVLIIDDEPRQVRSLSAIIRRYREDYKVYEAFDGQAGWDILETADIDAVITDIRMPNMDGMELIRLISARMPHIKMVLLTGYSEFQYAREALRHGVIDYLVKPIGHDDIRRILDKLEQSLADEAEGRKRAAVYDEHLLNRLVAGQLSNREMEDVSRMIRHNGHGIIAAIGIEETAADDQAEHHRTELKQKLQEWLAQLETNIVFFHEAAGKEWVVLIGLRRPYDAIRAAGSIKGLQQCIRKAEQAYPFRLTFGVSEPFEIVPENVRSAYDEAVLALRHQFYFGVGKVIRRAEVLPFTSVTSVFLAGKDIPLLQAIRAADWRAVSETVIRMFEFEPKAVAYPDPDLLKLDLMHFIKHIGQQLKELLPDAALSEHEIRIKTQTGRCADVKALQYETKKLLLELCDAVARLQNDKSGALIRQCMEYLETHYMKDITLESMARQFRFNASYFSNFFKSHSGQGFSECLLGLRIRNAKRLLRTTDEKIADVAVKVGFHDAAYFNKMFKRETGVSPNTFRQTAGME